MLLNLAVASALFWSGQGAAPNNQTPAVQKPQATIAAEQDDLPQVTDKKHADELKSDAEQGKKYAAEVEKQEKLSKNKDFQDRVAHIGQQLARIANHNDLIALWGDKRLNPYHYEFKVLKGDDINAFSLPGGHIYVYEGLLDFVESDDELAGVLGHEISHARFRHVAMFEHEASKTAILQIPLIIASILAHSADIAIAGRLETMSEQSGWTIRAEKAADFGGLQILMKSNYNPVAMLTFMERLAARKRFLDPLERTLGIFQTHPISRERAETMMQNLRAYNIPIQRSKASPSYRVVAKDGFDGAVSLFFSSHKLYTFGGTEARERAELAVHRLNKFFDAVPELYDVTAGDDQIVWRGNMLIAIEPSDAEVAKTTPQQLKRQTLGAIKQSLYFLAYRVWDGW